MATAIGGKIIYVNLFRFVFLCLLGSFSQACLAKLEAVTAKGPAAHSASPAPSESASTVNGSNVNESTYQDIQQVAAKPVPTLAITEPSGVNNLVPLGGPFTVSYTATNLDVETKIALFRSSTSSNCLNGSLAGWTLIKENLNGTETPDFNWDTVGLAAGDYFVCGKIEDGKNPPLFSVSPGALTIAPRPVVTAVTTGHADGAFTIGEHFNIKVTFDRSIEVSGGIPTILLETGIADKPASYVSGSGTNELTFVYIVQAGDTSGDLDAHNSGPQISLNGATIKSPITALSADLNVPIAPQIGSLATSASIVIDTTGPAVASPALVIGTEDITNLTIRPHWVAASDNFTAIADLKYKLVFSTTDNISTVSTAESNGTTVLDWTANTLAAQQASLLTKNTTYYFNVLVKDNAENKTIYTRSAPTTESMCGGTGTFGDPYQICTLGDLHSMRDYVSSFFILNNDIDATPTSTWNAGLGWESVGNATAAFTGGFNGNFKVIRGLTSNRPTEYYVGLFGNVNSSNTFENTFLYDVNLNGKTAVGAFAARLGGLNTARYLYSTGSVQGTPDTIYRGIGGLLGSSDGSVSFCFSSASVTALSGNRASGGLIGASSGAVSYSYATGKVISLLGDNTGGLVGFSQGAITYSYATGDVYGGGGLGGLVGFQYLSGDISYSFATGNVYATSYGAGGLVATMGRPLSYSLATGHVRATEASGGLVGTNLYGTQNYAYSLAMGKNTSTSGGRGALIGADAATGYFTLTKTYAYDWGTGQSCTHSASDSNCTLVNTGTVKPFAFRFSPELEFVQMKYLEGTPIAMRKVSAADKSAYRVWGSCTVQDATINVSASDGITTLNSISTCNAFSWEKTLNLSTLLDGAITIIADQSGTNSKTLNLTKEASYCEGNPSNGDFASGNGSLGTPYLICTTAQFDRLRSYRAPNTYFKLMNNLDLSSGFSGPIGDTTVYSSSYWQGILQGNGFILKKAYIFAPATDYVAIFGATFGTANISNLGVEESHVVGQSYIGILVGMYQGAGIENSYVSGGVSSTSTIAGGGGLSGYLYGDVSGSASFAHVVSKGTAGGFALAHGAGTVNQSLSAGNVISNEAAGGFVGMLGNASGNPASVTNSYATGSALSNHGDGAGGFSGVLYYKDSVANSWSSGSAIAPINSGGFVSLIADFALSYDGTIRFGLAKGHAIGAGGTNGGFAGLISGDSGGGVAKMLLQNVVAVGHLAPTSGNIGGILGRSRSTDGSQSTVTLGYFWAHGGLPAACIGLNENVTDPVTCNDVESAAFYQNFTNFTSLTSVYANWDFTNTWKFPASGGLPILKWQFEP